MKPLWSTAEKGGVGEGGTFEAPLRGSEPLRRAESGVPRAERGQWARRARRARRGRRAEGAEGSLARRAQGDAARTAQMHRPRVSVDSGAAAEGRRRSPRGSLPRRRSRGPTGRARPKSASQSTELAVASCRGSRSACVVRLTATAVGRVRMQQRVQRLGVVSFDSLCSCTCARVTAEDEKLRRFFYFCFLFLDSAALRTRKSRGCLPSYFVLYRTEN